MGLDEPDLGIRESFSCVREREEAVVGRFLGKKNGKQEEGTKVSSRHGSKEGVCELVLGSALVRASSVTVSAVAAVLEDAKRLEKRS